MVPFPARMAGVVLLSRRKRPVEGRSRCEEEEEGRREDEHEEVVGVADDGEEVGHDVDWEREVEERAREQEAQEAREGRVGEERSDEANLPAPGEGEEAAPADGAPDGQVGSTAEEEERCERKEGPGPPRHGRVPLIRQGAAGDGRATGSGGDGRRRRGGSSRR